MENIISSIVGFLSHLSSSEKLFGIWAIMVGVPVILMFRFRAKATSSRNFKKSEDGPILSRPDLTVRVKKKTVRNYQKSIGKE